MDGKFLYISSIEAGGLCGDRSVKWPLERGVNIISGINGSGKSTLLHAMASLLTMPTYLANDRKPLSSVKVTFEDGSSISSEEKHAVVEHVDVVSTFDTSAHLLEAMLKLTDNRVHTELDWQLYMAQQRFMRYQISLGRRAVMHVMEGGERSSIARIMEPITLFYDTIDDLFASSGKRIVRNEEEFRFTISDIQISPYSLSSGEKQLLVILSKVLTQEEKPYIMILDEPDISLHFDWQKRIVADIMALNPNLQLVMSTHSPAVILDGWLDRITDISELSL